MARRLQVVDAWLEIHLTRYCNYNPHLGHTKDEYRNLKHDKHFIKKACLQ